MPRIMQTPPQHFEYLSYPSDEHRTAVWAELRYLTAHGKGKWSVVGGARSAVAA